MFPLFSNISLSVRRRSWITRTRTPCSLLIAKFSTTQALSQDPNAARKAARRHRIATDPKYCEGSALTNKSLWQKRRGAHTSKTKALYRTDSAEARSRKLESFIRWWHKAGRINEWSRKEHQPVKSFDHVAHECTACARNRCFTLWWSEKTGDSTKESEKSNHTVGKPDDVDRYMCNRCYIKDMERMMPEKHFKTLPPVFNITLSTSSKPDVSEDQKH